MSDAVSPSEPTFRLIVEAAPSAIILTDDRGRIRLVNAQAERVFGYAREELVGQGIEMLVPERFRSSHVRWREGFHTDASTRPMGAGRDLFGLRRDGSEFPVEIGLNPVRTPEGMLVLSSIVDITERKGLERELQDTVERLAAADRQKDEFLAMLSHELRNPLAPMRNALQLMKMPTAGPDVQAQARDMMERQLHHVVRLVDDLLDAARIVEGKIELQRSRIDAAAAVERGIETARPTIDARGHELVLSLPEDRVELFADPVRIAQVVANLLTNAARYTPRAGRIWLSLERDANDALVRVRDRGAGIAPELLPRIFDLFVQGEQGGASQGGLGIGLTLVKRAVALHGGSVSAFSSGPGRGSEFVVRLPLAGPAEAGGASGGEPGPRATDALLRRVLVVDDNVDAAESIAAILRLSGFSVRCVYDGTSAVDAAQASVPDVVVLDIGLPDISGYEVARRLRASPRTRHVPLVAVTGYGQESDRRRSSEAGIDHHLTKPVDPEALQAFVAGRARG
jgi:PAS domain S-box-containing protein